MSDKPKCRTKEEIEAYKKAKELHMQRYYLPKFRRQPDEAIRRERMQKIIKR